MSCDNNNSNYFCSRGIINEDNAECQGASFIFECLKILLTASSAQLPHRITVNEHPPTSDESVNKLRKLFADMAPNDETSPRILVHIDEHRKMCPRNESSYRNETRMCEGALFSKGAMSTLVRVPGMSVIATYTEQPPLPPKGSSGVCRRPVPLPSFNVDAAMQAIKELKFHHSQKDFDGNQKRLWATLRFRLAMMVRKKGILNLHARTNEMTEFLQEFEKAANHEDVTEALKKCIKLCNVTFKKVQVNDPNALKLLCGVPDEEMESFTRQVSNLVSTDGIVTSSIECLLTIYDEQGLIFYVGQAMFHDMLCGHTL